MQIGQSQIFEVGNAVAQTPQIFAEEIDIKCPANEFFGAEPVVFIDAMTIQLFQILWSVTPGPSC